MGYIKDESLGGNFFHICGNSKNSKFGNLKYKIEKKISNVFFPKNSPNFGNHKIRGGDGGGNRG
jgi:hypothetical protein